jgi:hypothetical protein
MRVTRAAVAVLVVAGLVAGCGSDDDGGAVAANTPSGSSSTVASTTSTTAPALAVEELVGEWYGHGRSLTVGADGAFDATYRLYNDCESDPEPCDRMDGNYIIDGGYLNGRFTDGSSGTWHGTIAKAGDEATWPVGGGVTATLDVATDILTLHSDEATTTDEDLIMCGDDAETGACGA